MQFIGNKTRNIIVAAAILFFFGNVAFAQPLSDGEKIYSNNSYLDEFRKGAGFMNGESSSLSAQVANVIEVFLSLLGMIFVVLIIYSGYNWMTAGGDSGKVDNAKDTIKKAVVGLIIIISAYSITYFVFSSVPWDGSTTNNMHVEYE